MTDSSGPTEPPVPGTDHPEPPAPAEAAAATPPVQPPTDVEMTDAEAAPEKRRRRWLIPAVGATVLAVVAGGATWAALQLMSSGDPVESALPDSTLAFVSLDLDPSASQKIEAIKVMKKVPALAEHLNFNLNTSDDLRKWMIEEIAKQSDCPGFDYAKQVEPWIGDRAAVAGAENASGDVVPFGVVQVTDQDKARSALTGDFGCPGSSTDSPGGVAFVGQYALIADTQQDADYLAGEAKKGSLENDPDFQKWMKRLGDAGIMTAYMAPDSLDAALKAMDVPGGLDAMPGMSMFTDMIKNFTGAAAAVRFNDSGVELETVTDAGFSMFSPSNGSVAPVAGLPDSTAVAFGMGLDKGWQTDFWDALSQSDPSFDRGAKQFERQTGITLPDDLVTLLGDGFAISVDSSLDPNAVADPSGFPNLSELPVGLRIAGNPDAIVNVVDKINGSLAYLGFRVEAIGGDGVVGISTSRAYASELSKDGGLGTTAAFTAAVPQGANSSVVEYADFSAIASWVRSASTGDPSAEEVARNLDAFVSFGSSTWESDGLAHGLLKVTLK